MAHIDLSKDNLDEVIKNNSIVLIDFWAEWCGPCKMFGPVFEKASEKHTDIAFASCDTEAQQEVAAMFGIRSIPTLAVFKEQIMIFQQAGALPESALDEIIQKTRELDMNEVHQKIAEEEAKRATKN